MCNHPTREGEGGKGISLGKGEEDKSRGGGRGKGEGDKSWGGGRGKGLRIGKVVRG